MKVKILFILVFSFLFLGFKVAYAGVVINEIMYAPTTGSDYEWVEILNKGDSSVNLEGYRFFHGETNSGPLSLKNGDTFILKSGEYAVIAKSLPDYNWLNFSGMILSASTVSLPDSGDNTYIAISDSNKQIIDFIKYDPTLGGSKESTNSLSKINDLWKGAIPTPGVINESLPLMMSQPPGGGSVSILTPTVMPEVKPKVVEIPKIKTKIIANALGYVGIPFEIQASTTGFSNEIRNYGKYFWNFGDGDSKEINLNQNQKFSHTYFYPGEYETTLEYYSNFYSDIPETINRFNIKVISALVTISKVGGEKDFYVELSNDTDYDIDISKWMLLSLNKTFTLPKNTIIGSKSKMILSPKITNFTLQNKDNLKLLKSTGEVAFEFNIPKVNINIEEKTIPKIIENKIIENNVQNNQTENEIQAPIDNQDTNLQENLGISSEDITSSAVLSDVKNNNENKSYFFFWGFVVLLLVSGGAVYYIRRRNNVSQVGDDFKIIDE